MDSHKLLKALLIQAWISGLLTCAIMVLLSNNESPWSTACWMASLVWFTVTALWFRYLQARLGRDTDTDLSRGD